MRWSCDVVITAPTDVSWVFRMGAAATTSIRSATSPTSSVTSNFKMPPVCSTTLDCTLVLKPGREMRTSYVPGTRGPMRYAPVSLVTTSRLMPVAVLTAVTCAPGTGAPAARSAASGQPFPVSLVDVAERAGLAMVFVCGNEEAKRYIVEANGSGVALVDFDNDGWLDVFLVNGSRLEGFDAGSAPTNRL